MTHPFPWRFNDGNTRTIVDANDETVICDEQYYPWIDMTAEEWAFVVMACNAYTKRLEDLGFSGKPA